MYHRFKWTSASHRRNGISQEYEPLQPYFLLALIREAKCKTFVDVGANVGAYSVLMSQAVSKVVAFEANPEAAHELERNLEANGIFGEIVQKAASDRNGSIKFGTVSRLAGNSAVVETAADQEFRQTYELECVTLDSVVGGKPKPIAIKIDVEGHERQVLAGAIDALRHPCVLQVEDLEGSLEIEGYRRLSRIGPDTYFTNIEGIEAAEIFENACSLLIEANHENKFASLRMGPVGISISGPPYYVLKSVALKLFGSRL